MIRRSISIYTQAELQAMTIKALETEALHFDERLEAAHEANDAMGVEGIVHAQRDIQAEIEARERIYGDN